MQNSESDGDIDAEGFFENLFLTGDFEINSIPLFAGDWKLLSVAPIQECPDRFSVTYSKQKGGIEASLLKVILDTEIVYEISRQSGTTSVR